MIQLTMKCAADCILLKDFQQIDYKGGMYLEDFKEVARLAKVSICVAIELTEIKSSPYVIVGWPTRRIFPSKGMR
jgi:hypothetical protein